jgi:hypothetical protein
MASAGTVHGLNVKAAPGGGASSGLRALLVCGILSSLLYAAMNVVIPMLWEEYSVTAQTVSELSAIGAPTRRVWLMAVTVYTLLYGAFGLGVWKAAGLNHRLRVAGGLIIAQSVGGLFWPPMHLRGAEFTTTDAMHIVFAMMTLLLMMSTIGLAAGALGRRFRTYSVATLLIFVLFGALTGIDAPRIAKNLPTPWIGVWERINIAAFMLWVIVLASTIMRQRNVAAAGSGSESVPVDEDQP